MLKRILVVGVTGLVFMSAFAQQKEINPNVEKMQQLLNQAGAQASEQFNKTFAPSTPVPTGKNSSPPTVQPMPSSPPPTTYQEQPSSNPPPQKVPDVAVGGSSSGSSVGNIYAPGGNTQDSSGAANPYR